MSESFPIYRRCPALLCASHTRTFILDAITPRSRFAFDHAAAAFRALCVSVPHTGKAGRLLYTCLDVIRRFKYIHIPPIRVRMRYKPMAIHTDNRTQVMTDFFTRLKEAKRETPLTVFVCGPAVFNHKGKKSRRHGARVRDFVSKKIAERGSEVFWGEHRIFHSVGKHVTLKRFTNADNEVHFAEKSADLVLIFPDSAGSLAELGAFSLHSGIAINMLIVFDMRRKSDKGFVVTAVAQAAKTRKAQITFQDYRRPEDVWRFVERVVSKVQTIKLTSKSYAKS